ncbi:MAG: hypothetical protein ABIK89_11700 [Planctomycetota bacterium]
MHEPRASDGGVRSRPAAGPLRPELPSWLLSLVLHAVVLLALGLTLRLTPQRGVTAERTAEVGIALKHQEGDRETYQTEPDAGGGNSAASAGRGSGASLSDFLSDQPPLDPTASLPSALDLIGPSALGAEGVPSAGGLAQGPGRRPGSIGGKARATVFGITAEGWKFAYVFDRSDSMGWHDRRPLKKAKEELLASLDSLEDVHQFQIIFYNQEPAVFNPSGQQHKLAFATEQNKRNAERFIGGITAGGGTNHMAALQRAITLQPDVIFFLTAADDPALSAGQLYDLNRRAAGITIHTIEFGLGSQRDPNNFLAKLARQNGGQHVYVDVSKL